MRGISSTEKLNTKRVYYEFECCYQPIEIGQGIKLVYGDLSVKGLVTNIDIDIGVGGEDEGEGSSGRRLVSKRIGA